jgi:flagellar basal body-associated protein FliL
MEEQTSEDNRKKGGLLWIVIGLLVVANSVTFWMYWQEKNKAASEVVIKEQVIVERDNVKDELLQLQKDYGNLQTSDKTLQAEIEAKKAEIAQLLVDAEKHKGDAYIISKLKKESETLRQIMRGYVRTIDSLGTLNKTLIVEKNNVLKELDTEKGKITGLNKDKEDLQATIQKGSILTCFNVVAKGVKFKSGGKKESETTKASRTQKIKVSFSLGENKIAKAGEKTVYVRIVTPDGKEMAKNYDDNYKFTFNKSSGYFAGKETLNYSNAEISGVTYCEGQGDLVSGNYIIEISCDGVIIGSSNLRLD